MMMLPALTATAPASPDEKVLELIWPPLSTDRLPVAVALIVPAFPLPKTASLKMPVGLWVLPWLSMVMPPVFTVTVPASPEEKVLELIWPPLSTHRLPVAVTLIVPAFPLLSEKALLKMPVGSWVLPWLSMVMLPALTVTVPASPDEKVLELISPPLTTDRLPVAVTLIVPAFPLLSEMASLKMPVGR